MAPSAVLTGDVVYHIAQAADQETLKALRLVSKETSRYAASALFGHITLRANKKSFTKLSSIAAHPMLRLMVRSICYDGSLLPWNLQRFDQYLEYVKLHKGFNVVVQSDDGPSDANAALAARFVNAGEIISREVMSRAELTILSQMPMAAFLKAHQQYKQFIEEQKAFHRDRYEAETLKLALPRLPNLIELELHTGLRSFKYENGDVNGPMKKHDVVKKTGQSWSEAFEESNLTDIGRGCFIEPHFLQDSSPSDGNHHILRLSALVNAVASGYKPLKTLRIGIIDIERMQRRIEHTTLTALELILPSVEHFHFHTAAFDKDLPFSADTVMDVLDMATNLVSLNLQVEEVELDTNSSYSAFNLDGLDEITWPHLKKLRLAGTTWIEQGVLTDFLRRHSSITELTLENLNLTHSDLGERSCLEVGDNFDVRDCRYGSWVEIFTFLATETTLNLEKLVLNGDLSNRWNEAWTFGFHKTYEEQMNMSSDRCKRRIIDWILFGHPCPFTPRSRESRYEKSIVEDEEDVIDVAYDLEGEDGSCVLDTTTMQPLVKLAVDAGSAHLHQMYFIDELEQVWGSAPWEDG